MTTSRERGHAQHERSWGNRGDCFALPSRGQSRSPVRSETWRGSVAEASGRVVWLTRCGLRRQQLSQHGALIRTPGRGQFLHLQLHVLVRHAAAWAQLRAVAQLTAQLLQGLVYGGACLRRTARKAARRSGSSSPGSACNVATTSRTLFFSWNRRSSRRSAAGRSLLAWRHAWWRFASGSVSHKRTVPSPEPDTNVAPSGLKASDQT